MNANRPLLPVAEATLAAVTLAAVATLWRLFDGSEFLLPLAVVAVAGHVLLLTCRRVGLGLPVTAVAWLVGGIVTFAWVLYPATTQFGLPTGETLDAARTDLSNAWQQFQDIRAPAPVETGFVLAAALAVWVAAFVADWAAFRLWLPFEAVVPSTTLFVFASLLGSDNRRSLSAVLFGCAVLAFMLVHRVARHQSSGGWLLRDVAPGTNALIRVGTMLLGGALLAAAVLAPVLPGADADPLVPWRDIGEGPASRNTTSPMVELAGQLGERSHQEVFTVRATERDYWRVAALDNFDGQIWGLSGSFGDESGELPRDVETSADELPVTQQFQITALDQVWLPTAFEARSYDGNVDVRWDKELSTLIVENTLPNSNGAAYEVVSAVPRHERAALASVTTSDVPSDIAGRYLALPRDFSAATRQLAADITVGATTPYTQARALQDWFRTNITYDLEVELGFTPGDMETFLFDVRRGFCQQAAGTYAAMARAIGLPARVAVGYTPGEPDAADPTLYHVRGEFAHAWPEVYIAGYGWVAFEPTPLRGRPGAEGYTGVPEQQAVPGEPTQATTVTAPATTVVPAGEQTPDTAEPDGGLDAGDAGSLEPAGDGRTFVERWRARLVWLATGLLLLAVAYALAVPVLSWLRHRRRRQRAVSPDDKVRVAWRESVESVSVLGVGPRRSETPAEFAARADGALDAELCGSLATALEVVDYGDVPADAATGDQALATAGQVDLAVRHQTTRPQRLRSLLDPRPPDRRHRRRRPVRARRRADDTRPSLEVLATPQEEPATDRPS